MGDKAYEGDEEEIRKIAEEFEQVDAHRDKEMLVAAANITRTGHPIGKWLFSICIGNIFWSYEYLNPVRIARLALPLLPGSKQASAPDLLVGKQLNSVHRDS